MIIMFEDKVPVCHGCHQPHDNPYSTHCVKCAPKALARFLKSHKVTMPASDESRPVKRVFYANR